MSSRPDGVCINKTQSEKSEDKYTEFKNIVYSGNRSTEVHTVCDEVVTWFSLNQSSKPSLPSSELTSTRQTSQTDSMQVRKLSSYRIHDIYFLLSRLSSVSSYLTKVSLVFFLVLRT